MEGSYTSAERVVRDGVLVAFAGEVMTNDEAIRRGLVDAPARKGRPSKDELLAEAAENMTNPELAEAIDKAKVSPAKSRRKKKEA